MSGYFKLLAVYRTHTLSGPHVRIISDPVTVETFNGPRTFSVPAQLTRVNAIGKKHEVAGVRDITFPENERFIALTARSKTASPDSIPTMEDAIDRVLVQLTLLLQPHLFFEQIYRGPVWERQEKGWMSFFVRPGNEITVDGAQLKDQIDLVEKAFPKESDSARRYALMSRFYSRSLQYDPSEEKFLMLWTVLEIFPMSNTSSIWPLVAKLSEILEKPRDLVNEKLGIGRLHGIRSNLAHDGMLPTKDRHELFKRLELLVHTVLRSMCNLPYDHSLDSYF